jgi:hypothetical protein
MITAVINNNGLWVAGGLPIGIYYSYDGKEWTGPVSSIIPTRINVFDGIWVAGASPGLYYSLDGKEWLSSNVTGETTTSIEKANGVFVATTSKSGGVYYSTNGKEWSQSDITSGVYSTVKYINGIWYVGGNDVGIRYSTNGKDWTLSDITSGKFYGIEDVNGVAVAVVDRYIYYSTNGKEWTRDKVTHGECSTPLYRNGVCFVATVYSGYTGTYYSLDGMTWKPSNTKNVTISRMYFHNGMWVACGSNGLYYLIDSCIVLYNKK